MRSAARSGSSPARRIAAAGPGSSTSTATTSTPTSSRLASECRATAADVADFDAVIARDRLRRGPARLGRRRDHRSARRSRRVPSALRGKRHLVVVDDGFAWWPHAMAVELGVAAGIPEVTLVTPGVSFAMGLPAEGRAQMLKRLQGRLPLTIRPLTTPTAIDGDEVELRDGGGGAERIGADAVIVVGERQPRGWDEFVADDGPPVLVIGDAVNAEAHRPRDQRGAGPPPPRSSSATGPASSSSLTGAKLTSALFCTVRAIHGVVQSGACS